MTHIKRLQQQTLQKLTVLNENSLHSSSKGIDTLASESSGLGQVGVDVGAKVVP